MKNHRLRYTVDMMSRVLEVSASGYYKWLKTSPNRVDAKASIKKEIAAIYSKSDSTYGSPRVVLELKKNGTNISKSTVSRVMNDMNLQARVKKRYIATTDSEHDFVTPDNILDRNFTVAKINTVWVSDITYIRVGNHWMYLTIFLDLADRMIVGWTLSNNMTAKDTVVAAFLIALVNRGITIENNLMIHSDRGVQYAGHEFRKVLEDYNCIQSMSRKGNCWDNAVAESFFKTIKIERLDKYIFNDNKTLKSFIFSYIDGWYNTVRIHSHLDGKSPLEAFNNFIYKLAA
jgi:putative transposase